MSEGQEKGQNQEGVRSLHAGVSTRTGKATPDGEFSPNFRDPRRAGDEPSARAELFEPGDDVAVVRVDAVQLDEGPARVVVVAGREVEVAEIVEQAEVCVLGQVGRREPRWNHFTASSGRPFSRKQPPRSEQQSSR